MSGGVACEEQKVKTWYVGIYSFTSIVNHSVSDIHSSI